MSIADINTWASRALGDDPHNELHAFQQGLTVNLIATERAKLLTCGIDEPIGQTVPRFGNVAVICSGSR